MPCHHLPGTSPCQLKEIAFERHNARGWRSIGGSDALSAIRGADNGDISHTDGQDATSVLRRGALSARRLGGTTGGHRFGVGLAGPPGLPPPPPLPGRAGPIPAPRPFAPF